MVGFKRRKQNPPGLFFWVLNANLEYQTALGTASGNALHPCNKGLSWTIKLLLCVITQTTLHFISHFLSSHCISFAFSHCHAHTPPAPPIPFALNPFSCSHSDVIFFPLSLMHEWYFSFIFFFFSHNGRSGLDQLLSAA